MLGILGNLVQASLAHDRSHRNWKIDESELDIFPGKLGSGAFGEVHRGIWRTYSTNVAVKTLKNCPMSESQFMAEAEVMTKLRHPNVVQLLGVRTQRPIGIVTEYMEHGSLLDYLQKYGTSLSLRASLNICIQVCRGMAYLESKNFIHRDLAARNCLVGSDYTVKVSDFGLARYTHGPYVSQGAGHPIRWVPPEVFQRSHYSSKSDVWAYGVLMWEVFTCGAVPYAWTHDSDEVIEYVMGGNILGKPPACPEEIYNVMRSCWAYHPSGRPSFHQLGNYLTN